MSRTVGTNRKRRQKRKVWLRNIKRVVNMARLMDNKPVPSLKMCNFYFVDIYGAQF